MGNASHALLALVAATAIACAGSDPPGAPVQAEDTAVTQSVDVRLISPAGDSLFLSGQAITFVAELVGPVETVGWSSDREGWLGSGAREGATITLLAADLDVGQHTITVEVSAASSKVTASVVVTVVEPADAPPVSIEPLAPRTTDDLVAVVQAEGDIQLVWRQNGTERPEFGALVPASATARDDSWELEARILDSAGPGDLGSASVVILNSPPSGGAVSVTPATVQEGDTLTCEAWGAVDADGDPVNWTYRWSVGGTGATLNSELFEKDEAVICYATPSDGQTDGVEIASAPALVQNTLPAIEDVWLDPAATNRLGAFECHFSGWQDPDPADVEPTVQWEWLVDGTPVPDADAPALSAAAFPPGSSVICRVTPINPEGAGDMLESTPGVVTNAAPSVAEAVLTPSMPVVTTVLGCNPLGFQDPDSDPPSYTYEWFIDGAAVVGAVNATLVVGTTKGDTIRCRITPHDGWVSGSPVLSNAVVIANSAPTISGVTIAPLVGPVCGTWQCSPASVEDVDGGPAPALQWRWTVNGAQVPGGTAAVFAPTALAPGDVVRCGVRAFDGALLGPEVVSEPAQVKNATPTATLATVSPDSPVSGDTLTCVPSGFADDCAKTAAWVTQWSADDQPMGMFSTLDTAALPAGTSVRCTVWPDDGFAVGAPTISKAVALQNATPKPPLVALTDDLKCLVVQPGSDAEPLTSTIFWQVGLLPEVSGGAVWDGPVGACQRVRCRVVVSDGELFASSNVAERFVEHVGPCPVLEADQGLVTFDSDEGTWSWDAGPSGELEMERLHLAAGVNVLLKGAAPLLLTVSGDAVVATTVDASSKGSLGKLGGGGQGPGGGAPGGLGGGGGGYGGAGGAGAGDGVQPAAGGGVYGHWTIQPLLGGSGGGGSKDGSPGAGGGAIAIEAAGTLVVSGTILAGGGDGAGVPSSGGGGSGGAVRLTAKHVVISGTLAARGGSSPGVGLLRGGGGGGGRIYVRHLESLSLTGTLDVGGGQGKESGADGEAYTETVNLPPQFHSDPLLLGGVVVKQAIKKSLVGTATDPNHFDVLTWSRVSGPDWLGVDPDGTLTGAPPIVAQGTNAFVVQVADQSGATAQATLILQVGTSAPPQFSANPVDGFQVVENQPVVGNILPWAFDPEGAPLLFEKLIGPDWLDVTGDGTLIGVPGHQDAGLQAMLVAVSDDFQQEDQATVLVRVVFDFGISPETGRSVPPYTRFAGSRLPVSPWYLGGVLPRDELGLPDRPIQFSASAGGGAVAQDLSLTASAFDEVVFRLHKLGPRMAGYAPFVEPRIDERGVLVTSQDVWKSRDLCWSHARAYAEAPQGAGAAMHAERAARLLLRFAEVVPAWPWVDADGQPLPQETGHDGTAWIEDAPASGGIWMEDGAREVAAAVPLMRAWSMIRESPALPALSITLGTDIAGTLDGLFHDTLWLASRAAHVFGTDYWPRPAGLAAAALSLDDPILFEQAKALYVELARFTDSGGVFARGSMRESHDSHMAWLQGAATLPPYTPPPEWDNPLGLAPSPDSSQAHILSSKTIWPALELPDGRLLSAGDTPPGTLSTLGAAPATAVVVRATGHSVLVAGGGESRTEIRLAGSGGELVGSHDDLLALSLFARGEELVADPGGASGQTGEWARSWPAHATVSIEGGVCPEAVPEGLYDAFDSEQSPWIGRRQWPTAPLWRAGRHVSWSPNSWAPAVSVDHSTAAVCGDGTYRRTVIMVPLSPEHHYVVDVFRVRAPGRALDWTLVGPAEGALSVVTPLTLKADDATLYNPVHTNSGPDGTLLSAASAGTTWFEHAAGDGVLRSWVLGAPGTTVYRADVLSPRRATRVPQIVIRRHDETVFVAVHEHRAAGAAPAIENVTLELAPSGADDPLVVRVDLAGRSDRVVCSHGGVITHGDIVLAGRLAWVRYQGAELDKASLIDGVLLLSGGHVLASPDVFGTVTDIRRMADGDLDNSLTLSGVPPQGVVAAGRPIVVRLGDGSTHVLPAESMSVEGTQTVIDLGVKDPGMRLTQAGVRLMRWPNVHVNGAATARISGTEDRDPPRPPQLSVPTLNLPHAYAGQPYAGSIDGWVTDPNWGDAVTWGTVQGPAWLSVSASGDAVGTVPLTEGVDEWLIRATDQTGLSVVGKLVIHVKPNDPPQFDHDPLLPPAAQQDVPWLWVLADFASDPQPLDPLIYELISGPDWIQLSADGVMSGVPAATDVGPAQAVVRAIDPAGLSATAAVAFAVGATPDAVALGGHIIFDTDAGTWSLDGALGGLADLSGSGARFPLASLSLGFDVAVTLIGSRPLSLEVTGPVDIECDLSANGGAAGELGQAGTARLGGHSGVASTPEGTAGLGPGAGAGGPLGGGGGGYAGAGGAGASAPGGPARPLQPWVGGSSGGSAAGTPPLSAGGGSGGGGGVLTISSTDSILIRPGAILSVDGGIGGVAGATQTGAGGSGGVLSLSAPSVHNQGTLSARGGASIGEGPVGGGGGGGYIQVSGAAVILGTIEVSGAAGSSAGQPGVMLLSP